MQTDEEHITTFLETVETESHKRSMTLYSTSNQTEQELDWRKRGFVSHVSCFPLPIMPASNVTTGSTPRKYV